MKNPQYKRSQQGFTLAELLVSSVVFLLLAGAAFSLLGSSAQRFKTDSQVLTSFQEARLGIDQISRDIADAGFPPRNHFNSPGTPASSYAAAPFAWSPNYPATPCAMGGCAIPNGFDLIVETDYGGTVANGNNGVRWVRYQLLAGATTLTRADVPKVAGADPVASTGGALLLPYLQNVMNNATGAQIASIRGAYPAMFPGNATVPVFTYTCDVVGSNPAPCNAANKVIDIRDVDVTLIVQSLSRDAKTQTLRLVELHGLGHRVNPNQ